MIININDFEKKIIRKLEEIFYIQRYSKKHKYFVISHKNKRVAKTWYSHGATELSKDLLRLIKAELNLDEIQQLYDLRDCTMYAEDYLNLLKSRGLL